jgi:hypothetical protein
MSGSLPVVGSKFRTDVHELLPKETHMLRRSAVMLASVALLIGAVWVGQAICEENAPPPPPGGQGGQGGNRDPARMEQFRQQMSDRMKQAFGATDEEWKILQPKIEKVQTLARQSRGGGGMGMMFGRGGPGGGRGGNDKGGDRGGPPSDRPQSEVEKKVEVLQKVLENKEAKAEEIKTALAGVLAARAVAKKELEVAQKELREVLTVLQEARCVLMGIL